MLGAGDEMETCAKFCEYWYSLLSSFKLKGDGDDLVYSKYLKVMSAADSAVTVLTPSVTIRSTSSSVKKASGEATYI